MKMIKLISGTEMPIIGLGTYKVQGRDIIYKTLEAALAAGYRSIDTAAVYQNESDIGTCLHELLPKFGLKREDIFITSKLAPRDHGAGTCRNACLASLQNLKTDYLDLYLIHWPGSQGKQPEDPSNVQLRMESWQDMERLFQEGKLKAIGVSNYEQRHLQDLLAKCKIKPSVLQIEHHPHLVQKSLVSFCNQHNIHFQAYSSLGTTSNENKLLQDPTVLLIAKSYQKTPAQILLRWAMQQNIGVIPKSNIPSHIRDNIDIFSFTLSDLDMDKLSNLDTQHHYCWNPGHVA